MNWLFKLASISTQILLLGVNSGYQPPSRPPSGVEGKASNMAILTLICGIGSWVMFPVVAAIAGVAIGHMELKNIASGQSPESGKSITQIGYYLSIANLVMSILGTCVAGLFFMFMFGGVLLIPATQ